MSRLVEPGRAAGREDRLDFPATENYRLEVTGRGTLENLSFKSLDRRPPGPGQVEILIHATGLNFRDVLNALGEYPGDAGHLGNECSGEIVAVGPGVDHLAAGDRVLALAHGSFAHFVTEDSRLVARLGRLTAAEGATIPVAFLTAHYSLDRLGR